jgi:hypothetical protein
MKTKKHGLTPLLNQLMISKESKPFSILSMRDDVLYEQGLGTCKSESELRGIVYRRITWMLAKGFLKKKGKRGDSLYTTTNAFFEYLSSEGVLTKKDKTQPELADESGTNELKTRLYTYQIEMHACTGECNEYLALSQEFPHLRDRLQPMFERAKVRSSELIGHVAAINKLIIAGPEL